ncbi:MAG: hypothetical protein K6V73_04620 [Firmicutes bacterium]|nr:hypothetical protein [Bacillota bacterium]
MQVRKIGTWLGLVTATAMLLGGTAAAAHGRVKAKPRVQAVASKWLKVNAKAKTAVLTLLGGYGTNNGGMNFDGYSKGQMVVTVPFGWKVDVVFKNVGSLPHSVLVDTWNTPLSAFNPKPVFPGAESPNPVQGTPTGGSANFHFVADKVGKFRIICAFPGHATIGMWDTLIVSKAAKSPSIHV